MSRVIGWRGIGAAALVAAVLWSCQGSPGRIEPVTVDEIAAHIRYLSSDQMEGRAVGTPGIEMAARYHEDYFRTMGLEPAFGTSYRQTFPLKGSKPDPQASLEISGPAVALAPALWDEFVIRTEREDAPAEASGELVYCGYLIQAPERSWDDIKGLDLAGKVLLVEINEPGNRPGGVFDGEDMTYYGRWPYKFEKADGARRGGRPDHPRHEGRGLRLGRPARLVGQRELLPARPPSPAPLRGLDGRGDGRPRPGGGQARPQGPARRGRDAGLRPGAARAEGDGPPAPRLPDGRGRQRRRDRPGQTPGREGPDDRPLGPLRPFREGRDARRGPDLQRGGGQLLRLGGAPGHGGLLRPAARKAQGRPLLRRRDRRGAAPPRLGLFRPSPSASRQDGRRGHQLRDDERLGRDRGRLRRRGAAVRPRRRLPRGRGDSSASATSPSATASSGSSSGPTS